MGHYDSCRDGYCSSCGAAPGNIYNGVCEFCFKKPSVVKEKKPKDLKVPKSNYKIVKVDDKFYAVQGNNFYGNFYCDENGVKYFNPKSVREKCLFEDLETAEIVLQTFQENEYTNRPLKIEELN